MVILGALSLAAVITTAGAWMIGAVVLGLDLSGRWPRSPGFRWLAGGLLFQLSAALVIQFADDRKWARSQRLAADILGMVASIVLLACVAKAVSLRGRSPDGIPPEIGTGYGLKRSRMGG